MQGSFPIGADWTAVLDPPVDEESRRKRRSDEVEIEMINVQRRLRNPQAQLRRIQYEGPFASSAFFFAQDGKKFFILNGFREDTLAAPGVFGHYLVPTAVYTVVNVRLSRPFLRPEQNNPPVQPLNDAPGMNQPDPRDPPDPAYCVDGRDYTTPQLEIYFEIGLQRLKYSLEQAEALDLAFAKRMEGLGNLSPKACWDCQDPDYDPHDRAAVRDQFLAKYMAAFYDRTDPEDGTPVEDVSEEAVQQHKAFCQAWAKKHYKTLTPAVTAPAEALTSEFFKFIEPRFHPSAPLSRQELARVLMRHPDTAAEFASCLHHYSMWLEQNRGGRNASYKQMTTTSAARVASHRRMGNLLGEKLEALGEFLETLGALHERLFHPYVVDWHHILGQMPQVHRHFNIGDSLTRRLSRAARNPAAAGHVPPWRFGR